MRVSERERERDREGTEKTKIGSQESAREKEKGNE